MIEKFLKEDIGEGDITSNALLSDENVEAKIFSKEKCVLAGLEEAKNIFEKLGVEVNAYAKDGCNIRKGTAILNLKGPAKSILAGERTALNFLSRMSGIAMLTDKTVEKCRRINPDVKIAATRKTTPGFRHYEKKAVRTGGGITHRHGLYDAVLIKDNHIKIVGSVEECIKRAKKTGKEIEIEVENIDDAVKAANAGADIIMFDNFKPEDVKKAYKKIKEINKNIKIEISGGITPKNIAEYAKYADVISLGMLTHSVKSIDFSLEIV
ncbi:MAG: carboxylating nicotinate-nucleotide diphosphorylase [Thermoplasmatales archaeon]|nr:carboxylating nicotinate-nucleotide diphosphorylase [Thermoplasmatales archaeon]